MTALDDFNKFTDNDIISKFSGNSLLLRDCFIWFDWTKLSIREIMPKQRPK